MTKNVDYPHRIAVNTTVCEYCGQPQCDLCIKEHLKHHEKNSDKKIRWENME